MNKNNRDLAPNLRYRAREIYMTTKEVQLKTLYTQQ
jgi:hypothetical protein